MKRFLFIILFFNLNVFASCPGMKGEMFKRCECFETLERPLMLEQKCLKKEDCVVLHDKCGGWTAFNKKYSDKFLKKYSNPIFKSLMPEPGVTCHQNVCRLRPKVPKRR